MNFKSYFLGTMLVISTTATASTRSEIVESQPLTPSLGNVSFNHDGIYKFTDNAELLPRVEFINGKRIVDPDQHTMTFNRNEPVAVKFLPDGMVKISVHLSEEEKGKLPEEIIISAEDFDRSGLLFLERGDKESLLSNFSSDEEVSEARRSGRFNRRGRMHYRNRSGGSYYGCVAYVCRAIGGCSGKTGNGKGMVHYLRARGWQRVDCKNPPIGAVASWTGGRHGLGHTGIWKGNGWCYDQGCGDPGSRYRFMNYCVAPLSTRY